MKKKKANYPRKLATHRTAVIASNFSAEDEGDTSGLSLNQLEEHTMYRRFFLMCRFIALVIAGFTFTGQIVAQTRKPGSGPGSGTFTVGTDVHHDRSQPLRNIEPSTTPRHELRFPLGGLPVDRRAKSLKESSMTAGQEVAANRDLLSDGVTPNLVNGATGVATTLGYFNIAGVGNYFNGPDGGFTPASSPSDATGAVGTTQYFQWVDDAFAVFDKATGNALLGPVAGNTLWSGFGGACQNDNDGQPTVNFDKLANVWVVSQYAITSGAPYLQCVAVSTTADATGTWNRYSFQIGIVNTAWTNLNAKLGVWPDGYYMTFDMYSGSTYLGPKLCALNRTKMISGNAAGIQCIQLDTEYSGLVVSDLDSAVPPPVGAPAYFAADDLNYYALDLWKFHVDWNDSQNTTLSLPILLPEPDYALACGLCVPQPNGVALNSYGSHVIGRMPYRNYGDHQSLFTSETFGNPTGFVFYEMRIASSGDLFMYQEGEFQADTTNFRFIPSIASDRAGNIAVAYNLSSSQTFPGQYVATRAAGDPLNTMGNETLLNPGNASQTTSSWDYRSTLTVDPVDDCTYYYTEQYEPMDGTNNWSTQIENFVLTGCQVATVTLQTSPSGLAASLGGTSKGTPVSGQYSVGSSVAIGTTSPQAGPTGTQYIFSSWSDGGAITHNITVPGVGATYAATAAFTTQYQLNTGVSPPGGGTVSVASGGFYNAGSTVTLTATPATGYIFSGWTGNVASPSSASTSIVMSSPQSVAANFTAIPIVHGSFNGQSGPANASVLSFTFMNSGAAEGDGVTIVSFKLTQTAGTACSPVITTPLPKAVGNVAPNATIKGSIVVSFSSCATNARFSATMLHSVTGGTSFTTALTNLAGASQPSSPNPRLDLRGNRPSVFRSTGAPLG